MSTTSDADTFVPGDVIQYPAGINRDIETVTVLDVHRYPNGCASIRYRYTSNPRGCDWRGFVEAGEPELRIIDHDSEIDRSLRSLLP